MFDKLEEHEKIDTSIFQWWLAWIEKYNPMWLRSYDGNSCDKEHPEIGRKKGLTLWCVGAVDNFQSTSVKQFKAMLVRVAVLFVACGVAAVYTEGLGFFIGTLFSLSVFFLLCLWWVEQKLGFMIVHAQLASSVKKEKIHELESKLNEISRREEQ